MSCRNNRNKNGGAKSPGTARRIAAAAIDKAGKRNAME